LNSYFPVGTYITGIHPGSYINVSNNATGATGSHSLNHSYWDRPDLNYKSQYRKTAANLGKNTYIRGSSGTATASGFRTDDATDDTGNTHAYGGANTIALTLAQIPSHNHGGVTGTTATTIPNYDGRQAMPAYDFLGWPMYDTYWYSVQYHAHGISNAGSSTPHNNEPKYFNSPFLMRIY
jgi:hypothetical protein